MNVIVIHGLHGDIKATYEPYLEKEMVQRNIPILFPSFPKNEEAKYLEWRRVLDDYYDRNIINENTIIVSRCLGSRFILKYIACRKCKVKAFISIAATFEDSVGIPQTDMAFREFHVSDNEIEESIEYIDNRFAIYGDNDYLSDVTKLEEFAIEIIANKIFVEGMGHGANSSGVKKIPQIVEIIDGLC
jgi:predicted alpha/beta hydrolase family esterase